MASRYTFSRGFFSKYADHCFINLRIYMAVSAVIAVFTGIHFTASPLPAIWLWLFFVPIATYAFLSMTCGISLLFVTIAGYVLSSDR